MRESSLQYRLLVYGLLLWNSLVVLTCSMPLTTVKVYFSCKAETNTILKFTKLNLSYVIIFHIPMNESFIND